MSDPQAWTAIAAALRPWSLRAAAACEQRHRQPLRQAPRRARRRARRRAPGELAAAAGGCTVGVSWNNFQQPRWAAHDKPNIQKTVEAGGGTYIDADANLSTEQQLTDIDTLISKGAKVLIVLAQDTKAVLPALAEGQGRGHPGHRL